MVIWSPKDSITTKDLSTVSNSAGSFLKGPVLCVVRQWKITKNWQHFIEKNGGKKIFLGGRCLFFFWGGKDFRFMRKFMGYSWDQEGLEHVLFF